MNIDLSVLITLLQQPETYDHAVDKIQLRETHISLVIMTGQYVYKIKKSVDYGFLDFSTLEKRKIYCEEEVRLNSRLAPNMYLGVVPICGDLNSAKINGKGTIIEYAVKMRQFDTRHEFDKLLASHQLDQRLIDETAVVLANFHSNIAVASKDAPYSTPEAIYHSVRENFEQIALLGKQWLESHHTTTVLQSLRQWADAQHKTLETVFTARKTDGFIRECHGDLHLRNITLFEGKVTPFDGIEFNKNLSWIDVISDIAFILMDLDSHDRYDYSRQLLNRYLSLTGDYSGLEVLNYYKVYRAIVRAKVVGLRLLQLERNNNDLSIEIEKYLRLAMDYIQPKKAKLIITNGSSGSGKTFISQLLLEKSDIIRIRSDVERKRIIKLNKMHRNDNKYNSGIYGEEASSMTYNHLLHLAGIILNAGYSVIVDAAFLKKEQRQLFCKYAHTNDIPFLIMHCLSQIDLQRERLNKRALDARDASDADTEILMHQLKSQETLTTEERKFSITINNNNKPDLKQIIDWLKK